MRSLFYLVSAVVLAWAAVSVPLPLLLTAPSAATPICGGTCSGGDAGVVEVHGQTDRLRGSFLLTTVTVSQATTGEAVGALFDPYEDLAPREQLIPSNVDSEEFFRTQERIFEESVLVASAIGLREAGLDVTIAGEGARIVEVLEGSSADGHLRPGDVVVSANGESISLASELANLTGELSAGDELALTIRRNDRTSDVTVELSTIPGTDEAGLGVFVDTVEQRIELPRGVEVENRSRIGGPSAGLLLALTVYDLFSEEDLARGRAVAGTGTIGLDGRVGPIGGIEMKVRGAGESGAELFLAPAEQAAAARAAAPPGLEVLAVGTFQDALEALRR